MRSVLEDRKEGPVRAELISLIHDLNEDEQIDLVASHMARTQRLWN